MRASVRCLAAAMLLAFAFGNHGLIAAGPPPDAAAGKKRVTLPGTGPWVRIVEGSVGPGAL